MPTISAKMPKALWMSNIIQPSIFVVLAGLGLGGCTSWTPMFREVAPVVGPAPYVNRTPMNPALFCLRGATRATPDLRIGVADFVDGSGASMGDNDVSGRYFSQRPDLMLIVALAKTGVRLVNRTSTAVAEWEMRQAMDRRLGDGKQVVVGQTRFDYRPVRAGAFLGSTHYINGAITEVNWSLSNNVEEAGLLGATMGRRTYRVSIATDVVVTNSLSTELLFARSYSKQLVGYETGAGVFRFMDAAILPKARVELFQANIGQKQNEPVQQALRWMIELASYEVISILTGGDGNCDALVPGLNEESGAIVSKDVPAADAPPQPLLVPTVAPVAPASSPAHTLRHTDNKPAPTALVATRTALPIRADEVNGNWTKNKSPLVVSPPLAVTPRARNIAADTGRGGEQGQPWLNRLELGSGGQANLRSEFVAPGERPAMGITGAPDARVADEMSDAQASKTSVWTEGRLSSPTDQSPNRPRLSMRSGASGQ